MTIYCTSAQGLPAVRRAGRIALAFFLVGAAACDVQWGGASFELENPAPPPAEEAEALPADEERAVVPIPGGPLLWAVRTAGPDGALAIPVARFTDIGPEPLEFPAPPPDGYRARFDSAFAAAGTEMAIGAGGGRLGSLVLSGPPRAPDAGCPSVVPAHLLLPPGAVAPAFVFAVQASRVPGQIRVPPRVDPDDRIRTFGPILAEQLLREGGEARPFLAQLADLVAVPWPGDQRAAMAATYTINDSLDAAPPRGDAVSLFFLARFDPTKGYVADWSEMRAYGSGSREAYTWLEAMSGPQGRIDFAVLHDGRVRRLVASLDRENGARTIDWTEGPRCPALELLEMP